MAINNHTMVKTLQTLDPVRIGELNLLLDALSQRARDRDLTHKVISGMAARCDHLLQPQLYINLGKETGLISETKNVLKLTRLGQLMFANASWPPYDRLNEKQIDIIAPELLGHPEITQQIISVIRLFKWIPELSLFLYPRFIRVRHEQYLALKLLQATSFAIADNDYISVTKQNYDRLNSVLGNIVPRSEEDLWNSITETQLRAQAAEEFVVKYERQRLEAEHRKDLRDLVDRVSANDVNAGYDIRSFENNGELRHIEVKSSTSSYISFYWSSLERNFALEHRDSYWIYFVPQSQELPKLKNDITLIKDPVAFEGKCLNLEPSVYRVCLTENINTFPRIANGTTWARVIK